MLNESDLNAAYEEALASIQNYAFQVDSSKGVREAELELRERENQKREYLARQVVGLPESGYDHSSNTPALCYLLYMLHTL